MVKKMFFNVVEPEETRAAIIDNGELIEYDIENQNKEKNKNNIYLGTVIRLETSIQACFVDYGKARHGFLALNDLSFEYSYKKREQLGKFPKIEDILKVGQRILVQVVREEVDHKGAALSTFCSIPGRFLVLMTKEDQSGVSRKVEDLTDRKILKNMLKELKAPENCSIILRTACVGKELETIQHELNYLSRLWNRIQQKEKELVEKRYKHSLVYQEADLVEQVIRDYLDDDVQEIVVDDEPTAEKIHLFLKDILPNCKTKVGFYKGKKPLFTAYSIENAIEQVYRRKVTLPSGGSIVIDPTEALVSIDINSGKTQNNKGAEDTALKVNLEAVQEIARQLKLRDLGGLIVIDFISMSTRRGSRLVENAMKEALKKDKARVKIGRISPTFGLLSLSRQRIRDSKEQIHYDSCFVCQGTGKVANEQTSAMVALRHLKSTASEDRWEKIEANLPAKVANYLLNFKRAPIAELEAKFDVQIVIQARDGFSLNLDSDFTSKPRSKKVEKSIDQPIDTRSEERGAREVEVLNLEEVQENLTKQEAKQTPPKQEATETSESRQKQSATPFVPKKGHRNSGANPEVPKTSDLSSPPVQTSQSEEKKEPPQKTETTSKTEAIRKQIPTPAQRHVGWSLGNMSILPWFFQELSSEDAKKELHS